MEKLDAHIQFLELIIRDLDEYAPKNGKNKSIRNRESTKITDAVSLLEYYLLMYTQSIELEDFFKPQKKRYNN